MNRAIWLCGMALLLAAGCATTRYEEYGDTPEAKIQKLPLTADAILPLENALKNLEARLDSLEAELADRVGGLETANGDVAARLASLSEEVAALQAQLQALQEGGGSEKTQGLGGEDVTPLYEQGLMAYHARRYDEAKEIFRQVMARQPGGELADNAQYWIGECEYGKKEYRAALESFRKIFSYPKTEKYDDAQLKIGLCYLKLGDDESAFIELKRLVENYPESEYIGQAKAYIQEIKKRLEAQP